MRSLLLTIVLACHGGTPTSTDAAAATAVASTMATPSATETASATAPDPLLEVRLTLKKWNEAHNGHDSAALAALYAAKVHFYGQQLSGEECAKRKAAAFKKAPDYEQTVRGATFAARSTGTLVRFMKTSTSAGKSTDYASFIVVDGGRVTEESDNVTDETLKRAQEKADEWCLDGDRFPNDVVRPPFTISALGAMSAIWKTKHVKELEKQFPELGNDAPMSCPTVCDPSNPEQCGLSIRLIDMASRGVTTSILVEWLYVDAVHRRVYFGTTGNWESEPL